METHPKAHLAGTCSSQVVAAVPMERQEGCRPREMRFGALRQSVQRPHVGEAGSPLVSETHFAEFPRTHRPAAACQLETPRR